MLVWNVICWLSLSCHLCLYLGPYWTHVLFTWTQTEGLKVYINGTFSVGDATGNVSLNYGDPYADLVIGTGNTGNYKHYATGAFDEFVIWERALSPQDIWMYYKAAVGKLLWSSLWLKSIIIVLLIYQFIFSVAAFTFPNHVLLCSCQALPMLSGLPKLAALDLWLVPVWLLADGWNILNTPG